MTTELPSLPVIDFDTIGPAVGSRFPNVVLPDQQGRIVDLHAARNQRRALIVFYRSADW
jgi:peroxiredoxin